MGAAFDALNMQQSLGPRRPASATLPSFELPNPHPPQQKHQVQSITAAQPSIGGVKVGNLLTPPANSAADSSGTISSGVAGSAQVQPYSQGYWPASSYGFTAGRNNSHSSTMSDNLSPSYTQNAMYPSPLSPSPALSASSTPQQQHEQHQQQHPPSSHQQPLAPTYSNPTSGAGQQQPAHQANPLDPYGQKYTYGASQQPPSTNYNSYQSGPSSVQPSSSSAPPARVPAVPVAYPLDTQQPLPQFSRSYPSYSLPAMHGPIMSNIHNPNNQMALIGSMQPNLLPGFHSGHAASLHHVYSGHPHPHPHHLHGLVPPPQNDRPFRCDLCPQSFNRNHDLKRHKRIHLAVKPFPCHHCDKSFSRKDALKRHILVKGCGKDPAPENSNSPNTVSSTSTSAIMKNEGMRGTVSPPLASTLRLDK